MKGRLAWWASDLRVRIAVLLFAGVLMAGLGFDVLVVMLTEKRLLQELDHRAQSYAGLLATRVSTPLVLHDRVGLREELRRALREHDVVGVSVLEASGAEFAREVRDPGKWVPAESEASAGAARDPRGALTLLLRRAHVRVAWAPVFRETAPTPGTLEEMGELYGVSPGGTSAAQPPVGRVRMLFSTAGVEEAVRTASRMGLTILLAALALWLIPLFALLRVIAQPLHEASELARDIAAGQLDRRIPVRSRDELGTLAESLNTMASALTEAQARAVGEAEAMRRATDAIVAITQGARQARGLDDLFQVVASQLRQVTGSRGAALALRDGDGPVALFQRFDPPLPWGELAPGRAVDPELLRRLDRQPVAPVRIDVEREELSLARGLRRDGYRRALLVPLGSDVGGGALLLASERADAFPPSQVDVVMGLASHLGAALRAASLHSRLESAVSELEDTRERLERSERLRVAGEMASGVAHDFNNVLGAILGRAQLLRRRAASGDIESAELARALEIIEMAAQDGGDTVRRLRQFGAGAHGSAADVVDLDRIVRDAAEFTRARWESEAQALGRTIGLVIDSEPGATVEGRGSEMREVFTNLILNAIDALPTGGTIRLSTHVETDRVRAEVADDGVGMSSDIQRRIFDPFFTTKGERGTGLGLSVVYGIIHGAGGEIMVHSTPGRGTRMEVSLPRALRTVAERARPAGTAPDEAHARVMVVDDEPAVRELLGDILASLGHDPQVFESASAALAAYERGRYEVVFTDLGMPGMTGWELARALRDRDPDVTIAIITGWGAEVSPDALREGGADAVVSKPFTIEDIEGLVRLAREGRKKRAA